MIRKYRHQINRALAPRRTQSVRGMIRRRPSVRTIGHASIGKFVEYALVRVRLRPQEYEMFEGVGQSVVGMMPCVGFV